VPSGLLMNSHKRRSDLYPPRERADYAPTERAQHHDHRSRGTARRPRSTTRTQLTVRATCKEYRASRPGWRIDRSVPYDGSSLHGGEADTGRSLIDHRLVLCGCRTAPSVTQRASNLEASCTMPTGVTSRLGWPSLSGNTTFATSLVSRRERTTGARSPEDVSDGPRRGHLAASCVAQVKEEGADYRQPSVVSGW
jgi:hypothetical protein